MQFPEYDDEGYMMPPVEMPEVDQNSMKKRRLAELLGSGQTPFMPMSQPGQGKQPNPVEIFFNTMKQMNDMQKNMSGMKPR